ncbi:hypothetical protein VITFI_CDS3245 [Vitreoscilla filiformis]|uniref:F5/8 type C domain-containing protein n=1 Tax=Vitreoscilla filiformis TaxID=63 RepID=A0A221KJ04_VITFI|nr:hypothetical protein VITFI_CDS0098 [Vitreoscilla filiformis]ASM76449.1 hypothetical protein VITFI_CDS0670 [Vitreoscilla filiformis]ASM76826.1 hypothetical protein VITFI_CDS1048 [Vitreoscilla filiformis]ASM77324.1 hypothetical protein VITFI_CDS1546 [Vitreoscilla filiformis]ASM79022.1 hypothetical protein VITFI_CDS3245 [Vitreoscilla filiformis]
MVGELQFRSAAGSNLVAGGTAIASSQYVDNAPERAYDGAAATYWQAYMYEGHAPDRWIGYQWPAAVDVAQIAVQQLPGGGDHYWIGALVEWSDDGTTWVQYGYAALPSPTSSTDLAWKVGIIVPVRSVLYDLTRGLTASGAPGGAVASVLPDLAPSARDIDGGPGVIAGSVAVLGPPVTPLARRVLLISERLRRVVRETWSGTDGLYRFDGLSVADTYSVVCHDNAGTYRALIADGLAPTLE